MKVLVILLLSIGCAQQPSMEPSRHVGDIVRSALNEMHNANGEPVDPTPYLTDGDRNKDFWCVEFVAWNLAKFIPAFRPMENRGRTLSQIILWFGADVSGSDELSAGDVVFFDFDGDLSTDHVGIFLGTDAEDDNYIQTVDGNVQERIALIRRHKDSVLWTGKIIEDMDDAQEIPDLNYSTYRKRVHNEAN